MRTTSITTPPTAPRASNPQPPERAHHRDPVLARVLFDVWSGDPLVTVASPPGAGKTRLITHLAHQLSTRAGLRVAVATQTRAQAYDVTNRIAALGDRGPTLLDGNNQARPTGLHPHANHHGGARRLSQERGVVIATTSRWQWTDTHAYVADVLLVDEAWQSTHADLLSIAGTASQIVMVGDPGQIDPVVTGATGRWADSSRAPHRPAPDALLATHGEAVTQHTLTRTWRCGPATTDLLSPFYPGMAFTSARPFTALLGRDGSQLPELTGFPLAARSEHDPRIAATAADQVRHMIASTRLTEDPLDGTGRALTADDVAVVTPHVHQAGLAAAHLTDLPGVMIGTANSVQGSERPVVVVVHPMTGQHDATTFATDLGRTCVALSRHRAHATVLFDPRSETILRNDANENPAAAVHLGVIARLKDRPLH